MKNIRIDEKVVAVRELSFKDVRAWIQNEDAVLQNDQFNFVSDFMRVEGMSIREVCRMTDLTQDEIDEMTPSQLADIVAACKELNPYFFQEWERVMALARNAQIQGR